MGYKRKNTYLLVFEGDEFEGLEIEVRAMSVNTALNLSESLQDVDKGDTTSILKGMQIFADHLVRWNLEDDRDNPVPPTFESVTDLDVVFVNEILTHWMEAVSGVPSDLGKESTSGETSLEESIPMETL